MTDLLAQFQKDSPGKRWLQNLIDFPPPDWHCVIWPFNRAQNGYPVAGMKGAIRPHRIMCEWRHGPAPSKKHQAAHSCNRGHDACVNPWHLDWKTPSGNQLDRPPRISQRKLTPEQVDEIRALKGRERTVDTAVRFQVTEANIRQIQSGKTWALNSKRKVFSDEEINRIRYAEKAPGLVKSLMAEFGVSKNCINNIRNGTYYKRVPHHRASAQTKGE